MSHPPTRSCHAFPAFVTYSCAAVTETAKKTSLFFLPRADSTGCGNACANCIRASGPGTGTCSGPADSFAGMVCAIRKEMGGKEVEAFLLMLANDRKVAPSTHRPALSTLIILYKSEISARSRSAMDAGARPALKIALLELQREKNKTLASTESKPFYLDVRHSRIT